MTALFEHSDKLQRYLDRLQTSEARWDMGARRDFHQCGILTSVDSDEPVQPPVKVSKGAKIRNRYNQVPHLTQDTNGKVTNSQ